jgi:hypothetical protein
MLNQLIQFFQKDSGADANTAFTVIVTLFTFSVGLFTAWVAKTLSKLRKRVLYKKSLKMIINDFLNSCQNQHLAFKIVSSQEGFSKGNDYNIPLLPNVSQNYLAKLDINIFIENFSSIFHKNRDSEISELFEAVEVIKINKELLKELVNFTYAKYETFLNKYNENIEAISILHDGLVLKYSGVEVSDEFALYVHKIFAVFNEWKKNGSNNKITSTYNELIKPILDIAKSSIPSQSSSDALIFCLRGELAFTNITNIENLLRTKLQESMEIHKDVYERGLLIMNNWQ